MFQCWCNIKYTPNKTAIYSVSHSSHTVVNVCSSAETVILTIYLYWSVHVIMVNNVRLHIQINEMCLRGDIGY